MQCSCTTNCFLRRSCHCLVIAWEKSSLNYKIPSLRMNSNLLEFSRVHKTKHRSLSLISKIYFLLLWKSLLLRPPKNVCNNFVKFVCKFSKLSVNIEKLFSSLRTEKKSDLQAVKSCEMVSVIFFLFSIPSILGRDWVLLCILKPENLFSYRLWRLSIKWMSYVLFCLNFLEKMSGVKWRNVESLQVSLKLVC